MADLSFSLLWAPGSVARGALRLVVLFERGGEAGDGVLLRHDLGLEPRGGGGGPRDGPDAGDGDAGHEPLELAGREDRHEVEHRRGAGERHPVDLARFQGMFEPHHVLRGGARPVRRHFLDARAQLLELAHEEIARLGGPREQDALARPHGGAERARASPSATYSSGTTVAGRPTDESASAVAGPMAATRQRPRAPASRPRADRRGLTLST